MEKVLLLTGSFLLHLSKRRSSLRRDNLAALVVISLSCFNFLSLVRSSFFYISRLCTHDRDAVFLKGPFSCFIRGNKLSRRCLCVCARSRGFTVNGAVLFFFSLRHPRRQREKKNKRCPICHRMKRTTCAPAPSVLLWQSVFPVQVPGNGQRKREREEGKERHPLTPLPYRQRVVSVSAGAAASRRLFVSCRTRFLSVPSSSSARTDAGSRNAKANRAGSDRLVVLVSGAPSTTQCVCGVCLECSCGPPIPVVVVLVVVLVVGIQVPDRLTDLQ